MSIGDWLGQDTRLRVPSRPEELTCSRNSILRQGLVGRKKQVLVTKAGVLLISKRLLQPLLWAKRPLLSAQAAEILLLKRLPSHMATITTTATTTTSDVVVVVVVVCFVELKAPSLVPSHNSLLHIVLLISHTTV